MSKDQEEQLVELLEEAVEKRREFRCSNEIYLKMTAKFLLNNGVIVPPVQVGQTVYQLRNKRHALGEGISPRIISGIYFFADGWRLDHMGDSPCRDCDFNKTWFLTREEAEVALTASQTKGGAGT